MSKEGQYVVKTAVQKFLMVVKRTVYGYYINFGGKNSKITCIDIFVYDNDKTAKLQQIDYDQRCNLDENMSRGIGTRDMLQACLFSVKQLFGDDLNNIELEDAFNIACDNGLNVSLASYYLAFFGKTWYELHFGAVPITKDAELYKTSKSLFLNKSAKQNTDWFKQLLRRSNTEHVYHTSLLEIYEKTDTYREFFDELKIFYDRSTLCVASRAWVHQFMTREIFNISAQSWKIDLNRYSSNVFVLINKL
jgi:hypothetical protein